MSNTVLVLLFMAALHVWKGPDFHTDVYDTGDVMIALAVAVTVDWVRWRKAK